MAGVLTIGSLLLCQMFSDPVRGTEAVQAALKQQSAMEEQLVKAQIVKEQEGQARRRFEAQFNKLVTALKEFSDEYNRAPGKVWPAKQAAALKKAMRDLELADASERADAR